MRLIDADNLDFTIPENPHFLTETLVQVLKNALDKAPTIEAEPVNPELRKTVKLLNKEYARAKKLSFVHNPIAYALYQVWKAADAKMNGGKVHE